MDTDATFEAKRKLKSWFWLANIWRAIDYTIIVISFLSSMTVICSEAFNKNNNSEIVMIGSVVAATFTMLGFAIEPKKHMRGYRRAYSCLYEKMILENESPKGKPKVICDALIEGEKIINDSYDVDK